jgi:hypothetical protein
MHLVPESAGFVLLRFYFGDLRNGGSESGKRASWMTPSPRGKTVQKEVNAASKKTLVGICLPQDVMCLMLASLV